MRVSLALSVLTVLLFSSNLSAQTCATDPEQCAFATASGKVRRVISVDPATGTVATVRSYSSSALVRDVTVAPDHRANCATSGGCFTKLYVAVDDLIERMNLNGTAVETVYSAGACGGSAPTAPSGVRINAGGDLVFNSASGAFVIADAVAGACPSPIAGTTGGAGLASAHNGDLVISAGTWLKVAALTPTGYAAAADLVNVGSHIDGVAVDAANRIVIATSTGLRRYFRNGSQDTTFAVSFGTLRPVYIETRINPLDYLYVSLADADGLNGQVVRVSEAGATTVLAILPKVQGTYLGAVGMGIHPGRRELAATFNSPTEARAFNYGFSRFAIGGETITTPCAVTVTALSQHPQLQTKVFTDSGVGVSAIPQSGQQGFGTRYQVSSGQECLGDVRISWAGFFEADNYPQPGMGRIPDFCEGGGNCAQLLQTFYFSPVGPLPGDPIIENFTRTSGFVPVSIPLTNNFQLTWLAPMGTNPPTVINKAGSGVASFKFRLYDNGVVISDAVAATVTTVFSIAKVPFAVEDSLFPGQSTKMPPSFVYDTQDDLFRYNLDVSQLAPGRYNAIVLSNSTRWNTLEFCIETCTP